MNVVTPKEPQRRRTVRRFSRRWKVYVAAIGVAITLFGLVLIWSFNKTLDRASEVVSRDKSVFPGEVRVEFGPANDPSAVFRKGRPQGLPAGGVNASFDARMEWIANNDGVLASDVYVALYFGPAERGRTILIRDVRVRRTSCAPALGGFLDLGGGSGDTFGRMLVGDLDDPTLKLAHRSDGTGAKPVPENWRFPLYVNAAESDAIAIMLDSYSGSYNFEVDVDLDLGDGNHPVMRLDRSDDGEVFRVAGLSGARSWRRSTFGEESSIEEGTFPSPPGARLKPASC